jgi:hypothetical protein
MEISYELTQRDFTESFAAHRNRRSAAKWIRQFVWWALILSSAFLLFGAIRTGNTRTLLPFFGFVAILLVLLGGLPWWLSARKQFLKQPGAHGLRTVVFDASGTHWRWNGGSSDVEWRNYIRTLECENQILFYTSPACFNILPKRAITSEQLSDLRSLLSQNIQTGK